jgi:hypothetical protein
MDMASSTPAWSACTTISSLLRERVEDGGWNRQPVYKKVKSTCRRASA